MGTSSSMAILMSYTGLWIGASSALAIFAAKAQAASQVLSGAGLCLLAVIGTKRKAADATAAPTQTEPGHYPFDTRTAPWAHDGGPHGL